MGQEAVGISFCSKIGWSKTMDYSMRICIPLTARIWDYGMRFIHDDVKRVLDMDHGYFHGTKKNDYSDGSQTWRSEPQIANSVHMAHELNKRYLHIKWNEAWQAHVDGDTYKTPFNLKEMPVDFTTYDLSFVRRKHLGF